MLTVHIGIHKTGTSFLQNNVFPNVKGGGYLGKSEGVRLLFREAVEKASCLDSPYLISDEDLCGRGHMRRYGFSKRNMVRGLSLMLPKNTRIVLFFREPAEWISSVYSEYVHAGGCTSVENFLKDREEIAFFELIEALREYFPDRFLLFDHEQLIREPEQVVQAIGEFAGVRFDRTHSGNGRSKNISVKRHGLRMMRFNNRLFLRSVHPNRNELLYGKSRLDLFTRVGRFIGKSANAFLRYGPLNWLSRCGKEVVGAEWRAVLESEYREEWSRTMRAVESNQQRVIGKII